MKKISCRVSECSERVEYTEVFHCNSEVACPFKSYLTIHNSYLVAAGVDKSIDSTTDSEDESGSAKERESSSTENSEEYETESEESEEEVHCSTLCLIYNIPEFVLVYIG